MSSCSYQGGRLVAPKHLELRRLPLQDPEPWEAVVRVALCGICGTDLSLWRGDYRVELPIVLGHEFVGTVAAVGTPNHRDLIGRRVTGEINITCSSVDHHPPCVMCAAEMPTHCANRTVLGIIGADGAMAQQVVVPIKNLHEVPTAIPDPMAVLMEPLAAAIQTFEMAQPEAGSKVVVLGAGRLGMLVVLVAAHLGHSVLAVTQSSRRHELLKQLGAQEVMIAGDALASRVRKWTGGRGADLVVEATGEADGVGRALEIVRPRGVIAPKTTCGVPSTLDLTRLVVDEVQLIGSRCGPFNKAIDLAARIPDRMAAIPVVVHPLSEVAAAMEEATGWRKVAVDPRR